MPIEPRDGAWVAEATGVVDMSSWPAGTWLILRKERPHPGAQLNLPFHDMNQNRIWLAITALATELLAWTARLALPTTAQLYEPKRLRLRILAVAGRIVRTARRAPLKIDPAWPWADTITTAHARLAALTVP